MKSFLRKELLAVFREAGPQVYPFKIRKMTLRTKSVCFVMILSSLFSLLAGKWEDIYQFPKKALSQET